MPSFQTVGLRAIHRDISRTIRVRNPDASGSDRQTATAPSPAASVEASKMHLSTSVKSLIGIFTVVGLIILGVSAWKVRAAYRRKYNTARTTVNFSSEKNEKHVYPITLADTNNDLSAPNKAVLLPPVPSSPSVGWTPQIRAVTLPSGVTVPPVAIRAPPRSPSNKETKETETTPKSAHHQWTPPPPTYGSALLNNIPAPPPPPQTSLPDVPPPTPPASKKVNDMTIDIGPRDSFDLPPIPSPRNQSMHHSPARSSTRVAHTSVSTAFSGKALPRLMMVSTDFMPSRNDELAARAGETLRLLEEFEDQWCLVQRVGRSDAEKGVIPRFCLTERERIVKKQRRTLTGAFAFTGVHRK